MIVGVAVRSDKVMISLPKPNRHGDCFKYCKELGIRAPLHGIGNSENGQGFITDKGVYLNRQQSYKHVLRCGQKRVVQPDGTLNRSGTLYSEDVW